MSDLIHIILVEPQDSLNIGSVARAMSNLGFHHLHVVSPRSWDRNRAEQTACSAKHLLDQIKFHTSISDAVGIMQNVIAFSSRSRVNRPEPLLLPAWNVARKSSPPSKTALVFGPEDTGLTNEHLLYCSTIVRIPTATENSSYNLSQAVLVALYEISRIDAPTLEIPPDSPTWSELLLLGKLVDEIMWETEFYKARTPLTMPSFVRQLIFRIKPSAQEMALLLGMFKSIKLKIFRDKKTPPDTCLNKGV